MWHITLKDPTLNEQMFVQAQSKIKMSTFFGCILKSLQPLTVHSRQLLCVQPNDNGKRNTAKSCAEYSQCICSVYLDVDTDLVRINICMVPDIFILKGFLVKIMVKQNAYSK